MSRKIGSDKIRRAYSFLKQAEADQRTFTFDEFARGSGWTAATARANLTKKLRQMVQRTVSGYKAVGILRLSEEAFCRLCSQTSLLSGDPLKPLLAPMAEGLVIKARESALAAVQHYNNPTAVFRSGNYVILMVIAYTALFHAVFERDGTDYLEKDKDGVPRMVGKDQALWDLNRSAIEYVRGRGNKYPTEFVKAMTTNVEFFMPIRHRIEHRQMPQLDPEIAGHCQSMLTNFERILTTEFTDYYSLHSSLALALQFSTGRTAATVDALRAFHSAEYADLKQYINEFHSRLSDDIMGSPDFAFRVWLVPKPAKHARASDITVEFVPLDQTDPEQMEALEKSIVAIKRVVRETRNETHLLPKEVSRRVHAAIGRRFAASSHNVRAAKHHKVRPDGKSADPTATNADYCVYDQTFKTYVYTEKWVEFLIKEYKDEAKYNRLFGTRLPGKQKQAELS